MRGSTVTTPPQNDADDEPFDWWWVPAEGGEPIRTRAFGAMTSRGVTFLPDWELDALPEAWTEDGVLFSGTLGQATNLWRLKISQQNGAVVGPLVRLTNGAGADVHPSVDSTGRVAFEVTDSTETMFRLSLDANGGKSRHELTRLAADWGFTAHRGSLSQDGRTFVFPKHRPTVSELWLKDLGTGVERHLVTTPFTELNPSISPDGSQVAYRVIDNGRPTTYVIAAGGAARRVCDDCTPHNWLKDNRRLLTVFMRSQPRVRILDTVSLQTAGIFTTTSGINRVIATTNNRWFVAGAADVAWVAPLRTDIVASDQTATEVRFPRTDVTPGRVCGWSPNGRLLYSLLGIDGFRCLYAQRFDPASGRVDGQPFVVHHFHDPQRLWGSTPVDNAIVQDGFVFDQLERSASIWLRQQDLGN